MAIRKLLLITAGTIAASVGQKVLEQMESRPTSNLKVHVRYLETAYLPNRYPNIRQGEWQQMTINAGHIQAVYRNNTMEPHLQRMLYPGLLPETAGVGGGGIRYNGAGAVVVNRNHLKKWLGNNMVELVKVGSSETSIYMALVISSVGATGSGSLERLIDVIIEAATNNGIPLPIRCDVFILQPGMQGVTDLGLANTLALYAEMAASRLSQDVTKQYQGRTVMIGWGSKHSLGSIEQLQEAAATLIRVSNDPTNGIVAEYQEREVDNHVLRETDAHTHLPTHLSSATAVTISLGNLEEKVIQRDAIRLIDGLVFGTDIPDNQGNILTGAFSSFLSGNTPKARYTYLLENLYKDINTESIGLSIATMNNVPGNQRSGRLMGIWQMDKNAIEEGSNKIEAQANSLAQNAIKSLERTRRERMATGLSLERLRNEYQSLHQTLITVLNEAQEDSNKNTPDDTYTTKTLETLNRPGLGGAQNALRNALGAVGTNIEIRMRQKANPYAIAVLDELQYHCAETVNNLDVILQKLRKERDTNSDWSTERPLKIATGHLLQMPALSSKMGNANRGDETKQYYDKVSIFAPRQKGRGVISLSGNKSEDQLASFRKWLKDRNELDMLFKGEINLLLRLAQDYARDYVHSEVQKYSILDILTQMGGATLRDRLAEAAALAHSFVVYNEGFIGDRPEVRHVSAFYRDDEQKRQVEIAINEAFGQGRCTLLKSDDPTEIVVFYYIDGLPMSAITDLNGRCLNAFLKRRYDWYKQVKTQARASQNGNNPSISNGFNQKVGVPIYSGYDAEQHVRSTGVICQLYKFKEPNVDNYRSEDIPELDDCQHREQSYAQNEPLHATENDHAQNNQSANPVNQQSLNQ